MKITGLASTSGLWQGCIFHHVLDARPAFGSLIISCDRASLLMKEAWFDWGQRELAAGAARGGCQLLTLALKSRLSQQSFGFVPFPLWRRVSHSLLQP